MSEKSLQEAEKETTQRGDSSLNVGNQNMLRTIQIDGEAGGGYGDN